MKRVIGVVTVLLSSLPLTACWDMGTGQKIGSITRLNKMGAFCKTWEGEIIRGGLNTGSGVVGQAFHFTVESEDLAKEVERAMNNQQEVRISYRQEGVTWCRSDSGDYFLTKIEPLVVVSTPPTQSKEVLSVGSTAQDQLILQTLQKQQQLLEDSQKLIQQLIVPKK
ncbi:MAG: hypothetical protein ABL899_00965 [Nitrospira sp.]